MHFRILDGFVRARIPVPWPTVMRHAAQCSRISHHFLGQVLQAHRHSEAAEACMRLSSTPGPCRMRRLHTAGLRSAGGRRSAADRHSAAGRRGALSSMTLATAKTTWRSTKQTPGQWPVSSTTRRCLCVRVNLATGGLAVRCSKTTGPGLHTTLIRTIKRAGSECATPCASWNR